jgi:membrane-associated phospholipid phosphatase
MPSDIMDESLSAEKRSRSYGEFVRSSIYLFLFFCTIFFGADMVTRLRDKHLHLYFAWERHIPFYPPAYVVYYSVLMLPFLIPVFLHTDGAVRLWRKRMLVAIGIAGLAFLLFPAELGYPKTVGSDWLLVRNLTPFLTGHYNLVPSLHVALMIIILCSIWPCLGKGRKPLSLFWGSALTFSTLVTHQHHVLDVVAGYLLGFIVCYWVGAKDAGAHPDRLAFKREPRP